MHPSDKGGHMKLKYFIPLILLLAASSLFIIYVVNYDDSQVFLYLSVTAAYVITYFFGIRKSVKCRDIIIKINNISPFTLPYLFFIITAIFSAAAFLPKDTAGILIFFSYFTTCFLFYFSGIFILIIDLKKKRTGN